MNRKTIYLDEPIVRINKKLDEVYSHRKTEYATGYVDACIAVIKMLNSLEEARPQWIPYEDDTLPEIDEEICVIDIDDNVNWTHRTKYGDWLYDPFGNHLKNIVGWFPLPKMKKKYKVGTDMRGEKDADSD